MSWLKENISSILAFISIFQSISAFVYLIIHCKKGHKIPDAKKIELKRKRKELKQSYKDAVKAIKHCEFDDGGK